MADQMRAGEGTLARGAGMVADAKVDFDRLAGNLNQQLLSAQSKWQGAGGTAFIQLATAWDEKQRVIVSALNEFETHLQGTQSSNTATDDAARAAQVNNLARLDGIR